MSSACLVTVVHFAVTHHGVAALDLPLHVYGITALMAIFSTVIPAFLFNAGMQRIGSNSTSIISSVGPVLTLFYAYILLGETLTPAQLFGTLLVITGVVIVSTRGEGPA